jgi:flagellar protein FlaG
MGTLNSIRSVAGGSAAVSSAAYEFTGREAPPPLERQAAAALNGKHRRSVQESFRLSIERVADALEHYFEASQRDLQIQIHERTGRIMVKVVTKNDGKVVREIPPEDLLDLAARMDEMVGLLFDKNA